MSGPVTATPAGVVSDKVAIQLGPDERALKLAGSVNLAFGTAPVLEANLAGKQLELDRFVGIGPDKRQPPAAVLARLAKVVPVLAGAATNAQIDLTADGLMLGGELTQNARASIRVAEGKLQVDRLEADLPGNSHLLLAGDVNDEGGGFKGNLDLKSDRATGLIGWLQGQPVLGRPDAARKLSLKAALEADTDKVDFSQLTLAIDDAAVKGRLAWNRLAHGRSAGRVEANLAAQRIDLDALPSVAALLPGSSDLFSEADVRLQAQELALSGIEAKSVSGHIKAGGKLIALEDVVVSDLGGANLTANGRIDNIGAEPQGEIRVVLNGKDLSGLATALKRSTLPAFSGQCQPFHRIRRRTALFGRRQVWRQRPAARHAIRGEGGGGECRHPGEGRQPRCRDADAPGRARLYGGLRARTRLAGDGFDGPAQWRAALERRLRRSWVTAFRHRQDDRLVRGTGL
jgi:large subunit ribosomal protein L24